MHDVPPLQWGSDIRQIKEARFTVVHVGHLA